jgi:hypothetical protein
MSERAQTPRREESMRPALASPGYLIVEAWVSARHDIRLLSLGNAELPDDDFAYLSGTGGTAEFVKGREDRAEIADERGSCRGRHLQPRFTRRNGSPLSRKRHERPR